MSVQSIILIDENLVPEDERADLAEVNAQLQAVAARRKDRVDVFDYPYRLSKIAWKIAEFSNAMTYRFISLAEGVALSWNNSNALSAVLNARAIVETTATYWEFGKKFSKLADALDFGAVDRLAMNYLFSTRDAKLLEETPELKARQVLNAIDLIDKTLIPHFRSHLRPSFRVLPPKLVGPPRAVFQTRPGDWRNRIGSRALGGLHCSRQSCARNSNYVRSLKRSNRKSG